jgi:TRAP-type mannitol/chloroaromatic compound transport system substrate-binding protein
MGAFARGLLGGLALLVAWGQPSPAEAQQPIKWKMMSLWGAGSLPQKLDDQFAARVKALSGGRLVIESLPGGSIVAASESLDALSAGVLDIQNSGPAYNTGKDAAFALIGDLCGGWESPEQAQAWMDNGGGRDLTRELYRKYNAHFVRGIWYGRESLVSKKPLRTLADFKGLKLRAPTGMGQDIFRLLGAAPVNLPGSEVYTALERGVVDAADWGTLSMNQDLGYHKLAKYPSYPGFHSMPMSDLVVNAKKWNALPDDLKKVVEQAADELNRDMIAKNVEADELVARAAKQSGVEMVDLAAPDRRRFREVAEGVWKTFAARSAMAKRVHESQVAYLRKLGLL